mgnify:CR=1 FL=1
MWPSAVSLKTRIKLSPPSLDGPLDALPADRFVP